VVACSAGPGARNAGMGSAVMGRAEIGRDGLFKLSTVPGWAVPGPAFLC